MAVTKTKQRKKKRRKEARKLASTTSNNETNTKDADTISEEVEQDVQSYECSGEYQLQSFSYTIFGKSSGRSSWNKEQ